jgi:hypothetical protein
MVSDWVYVGWHRLGPHLTLTFDVNLREFPGPRPRLTHANLEVSPPRSTLTLTHPNLRREEVVRWELSIGVS